jgi:hypothetical protein
MRYRILLPLASLLIASLSAQDEPEPPVTPTASAETEHQADCSFTFNLTSDSTKPSKAVLFTGFADSGISGTVLLGPFVASFILGMPNEDPRRLVITVDDRDKPLVLDNNGVVRNHLVRTELRYKGPGTYRIAMLGDRILSVTVKEAAAK